VAEDTEALGWRDQGVGAGQAAHSDVVAAMEKSYILSFPLRLGGFAGNCFWLLRIVE
jgi:hypothetical protein